MHDWTEDDDDDLAQRSEVENLEARVEELEKELQAEGAPEGRVNIAVTYTMGASLAMILSWSRNHSILWCVLHGFFSWLYVIFFAFTRGPTG
jgi:hypothetical protein